jgi:hypothetical protein
MDERKRVGMTVNAHFVNTNLTPRIARQVSERTNKPYYRVRLECDVIDSPDVTLYLSPDQVLQLSDALRGAAATQPVEVPA